MGLTLYPVPGKEKSKLICNAFAAGAPKHATGAVFFGTEGQMQNFRRAQQGTWWYIDNSYFDKHRGIYFRVTKNALQVDPRGKTSTGERFAELGIDIKPWRPNPDGYILVCPQSDDFMKSTLGRGPSYDWTRETLAQLEVLQRQAGTSIPVKVRPWNRDKKAAAVTLESLLPDVRLLISHSSSASITAMIEGVPSLSIGETAAAYHLTGPLTVESLRSPPMPEGRLQFFQVLADNQATLEEFRNGKVWRWLEKT